MILVRIIHDHHDQITLRRRKKEEENLSCYSHAIYISSICQERSLYLDTTSFTIHLIHGRFISNISSSINFFFFFLQFVSFIRISFWIVLRVARDANCSLVGAVLRVVNNHVASNSSFILNSFFTSTSSIMLLITSSVTDERSFEWWILFINYAICNSFHSQWVRFRLFDLR